MRLFPVLVSILIFTAGSVFAIDAPTNLSAELNTSDGSANLSWSATPDATGYNVYRDDSYVATVTAPETSYNDPIAGSMYYLTAVDNSKEPTEFSSQGNTVTVSVKSSGCDALPSHSELTAALRESVAATGGPSNGGFDLNMWAALVNRDGVVCAVTHTGATRSDQWPGSRVIAAQKANTANAFSLPGLALSTANLWAATQPGGSLFGLQFSNPVDPKIAYGAATEEPGSAEDYGKPQDPMNDNFIGGINVFGGGVAIYDSSGQLLGAVGVSGDTSCADHNVAWRTRAALELDYVPGGVGTFELPDGINYIGAETNSLLQNDFSHPVCAIAGTDSVTAVSASLPGDT